jgi:hypothetical protein
MRRSRRQLIRLVGTAGLAGVTAASYAVIAAHALGVSMAIAGCVSGLLTAIVVGSLIYRHGEPRPDEAL